jgi:hypothetical protein
MPLFSLIWIVFDSPDRDRTTPIGLGIENQMNTNGCSGFTPNERRKPRAIAVQMDELRKDIMSSAINPKKGIDEDILRVELQFEKHVGQISSGKLELENLHKLRI